MNGLSKTWNGFLLLACAGLLLYGMASAAAQKDGAEKAGDPFIGLWEVQKESGALTLLSSDHAAPIKTLLTAETRIEGICTHCQIDISCRAGELAKRCAVCPCGLTNAQCLTGKASAEKNWALLLQDLPRGVRLQVEWIARDKPEQGLKRLVVDRHGALLSVDGLEGATPEQVQALGKSVGAARTEWNASAKYLQLRLKDNWTLEKEQRLEKALEKSGARVSAPKTELAAP